jgi:tetratricopeptide (TPR) repeat protein
VYRKKGEFQKGIEDYSNEIRYLQIKENSSEMDKDETIKAFNNRAYCYAKLSKYEEAIKDYSEVIVLNKFNIHALHNRGISFQRSGQFQKVNPQISIISIIPIIPIYSFNSN